MTIPKRPDTVSFEEFDTPVHLAVALANRVATALETGLATHGEASLLVSGGSTPKEFFAELSKRPVDWEAVTITLVDERWVPDTSERSNARLVAENLMQGEAHQAKFVPLFVEGLTAAEGAEDAARVTAIRRPFDAVILGMGNDGHTASFFPGGDQLEAALDLENPASLIAIEAEGAGEPRITFTLRELLDTGLLVLHVEGAAKRDTLEKALGEGPVAEMPVRAVLRQALTPLSIYWCP